MKRKPVLILAGAVSLAVAVVVVVVIASRKRKPEPPRPEPQPPAKWTLVIPPEATPETRAELEAWMRSDSTDRYEILRRLEGWIDPAMVAPMKAIVARPEEHVVVRVMAARILAQYGDASGRETLVEGLKLQHFWFRKAVLADLARLDGEKARPYAERALDDPHAEVRAAAARILIRFGDRGAHSKFVREARDASLPREKRESAVVALGLLEPDEAAYRAFVELLQDPSHELVVLAIERLVPYGNREVIPALRRLTSHPKQLVRDTAQAAVEQLER
jgi:HEAT repeat protein